MNALQQYLNQYFTSDMEKTRHWNPSSGFGNSTYANALEFANAQRLKDLEAEKLQSEIYGARRRADSLADMPDFYGSQPQSMPAMTQPQMYNFTPEAPMRRREQGSTAMQMPQNALRSMFK